MSKTLANGHLGPCDVPVQLSSKWTGGSAEGFRLLQHLDAPLQTEIIATWIDENIEGSNIDSYEIGHKFSITLSGEIMPIARTYNLGYTNWIIRLKENNQFYVMSQEAFDGIFVESSRWDEFSGSLGTRYDANAPLHENGGVTYFKGKEIK